MNQTVNLFELIENSLIETKIENSTLECLLKDENIHYKIDASLLLFARKNNIKNIKLKIFDNLKISFSIKKIVYNSDLKLEILPQNKNIENLYLYFFSLSGKNFDISNCIKPLKNINIKNLYISGTNNDKVITKIDLNDFIIKENLYLTSIDTIQGKLKNSNLKKLTLVNIRKIIDNPFMNVKIENLKINNYLIKDNINYSKELIKYLLENSKNIELDNFYFNNKLEIINVNNILIENSSIETIFVKNINSLDTFGYNNIESLFIENSNIIKLNEICFKFMEIKNSNTIEFEQRYQLNAEPEQIHFNNINNIKFKLNIENFCKIFSIINVQNVQESELSIKFVDIKNDIKNFLEIIYNNFDNISNLNIEKIDKTYKEWVNNDKIKYLNLLISVIINTKNKKEFVETLINNYLEILKLTNYIEKKLILIPDFILKEKKLQNGINSFSSSIKII